MIKKLLILTIFALSFAPSTSYAGPGQYCGKWCKVRVYFNCVDFWGNKHSGEHSEVIAGHACIPIPKRDIVGEQCEKVVPSDWPDQATKDWLDAEACVLAEIEAKKLAVAKCGDYWVKYTKPSRKDKQ